MGKLIIFAGAVIISGFLGTLWCLERRKHKKHIESMIDCYRALLVERENMVVAREREVLKERLKEIYKKIKQKHEKELAEMKQEVIKAEDYSHRVGTMAMGTYREYMDLLYEKELLEQENKELKEQLENKRK